MGLHRTRRPCGTWRGQPGRALRCLTSRRTSAAAGAVEGAPGRPCAL